MSLLLGGTKIDSVYLNQPSTGFTPMQVHITTVGAWSYTIPAGATMMDVVIFAGGGGGNSSGAFGDADGGSAGKSAFKTYTVGSVGSDFAAGAIVTGFNGAGGARGTGAFGDPKSGTGSTFVGALNAVGGAHADQGAGNPQGETPPPVTLNGRVYVGGAGGNKSTDGGLGEHPASAGGVGGGGGGGGGSSATSNPGGNGGSGCAYLYFYSSGTSSFGLASAVYLGTEKVWPMYVATLSPWYTPGATPITVAWPNGAEFVDVVVIGGGAGGTGTGIGGNPQLGGGAGPWSGVTKPKVDGGNTYDALSISLQSTGGNDGVGGGNFTTQAADGSAIKVNFLKVGSPMIWFNSGSGQDKSSSTGNRNGGSVTPSFLFNGRTYTVASYGAGAGAGGATGNKNGGNGALPGGGGQSADNGGLTGYSGGNGAHGAVQLYWY